MESTDLNGLLEQLHTELSRAPMDEERRKLLTGIQQEIEQVLARPAEELPLRADEQRHLQDRLQAAAVGFEGSHPQLASLLEQTFLVLSNLGL